ncbi:MAG: TRAP transporter large permease subunit [Desulfovibrionaceae bacterium]|jgi:tripartite ATP-independent transporter DctM subunit|nr:TRAP transporter large permease subunit [Desulfovibrionaceae bacterium]
MDHMMLITLGIMAVFFLLLIMGQPVFAALGTASIVGILVLQGPRGLAAVPGVLYDRLNSFTLVAVPLFILMGEIIFVTGIGSDLYNAASSWLNRLRGGLAMASVVASAIFGALCGVSIAGAATIGSFAIPEMLKRGYHKSLATGPVTAAGALSLLIPPSLAFILYGEVADESVGKLFVGGIVPGVALAIMMMIYIWVICKIRPEYAPDADETITWADRAQSIKRVIPSLGLIVAVLGTIYFGICTPTESAAIGCVGSLLINLRRKTLTWASFRGILQKTMLTSGMILLIFSSALLFGYVLTRLRAPQNIIGLVEAANLPDWGVLTLIMAILIVMGMFMDIVSVILISTPLLLPMVQNMGYDPLWYGIIVGITCEMAVITPPIGLNLYAIKGIAPDEISLQDIIKAAFPFVFVELAALVIFIAFPSLSLWLPNNM